MAERNVSVLILPDRWGGSPNELAERLVSMTHQSADRLAGALARGPLTIDADLRPEEAERLCAQLERLGVPAEARADDGTVVVETDAADGGGGADGGEPARGDRGEAETEFESFDEFGESLESVFESAEVETDPEASFDELESVDEGEGSRGRADGGEVGESGGWGEVLGTDAEKVGEGEDAPAPREESGGGLTLLDDEHEEAPSLEELGGDESASVDRMGPGGEDSKDERPPQPASPGPPGADTGPAGIPPDELGRESEGRAMDAGNDGGLDPEQGPDPANPASPAGPPSPRPPADDGESNFDTVGMTEALSESTDGGQFEDGTFDDRPEHVPALAALLSLLAPGAGQIYNGQSEEAWEHALYAPLLWPWYQSVREALERGRAIRQREAPKPEAGTFVAALKHIAILYVAVGGFAVAGYLGVGVVAANWGAKPSDEPAITEVDVRRALQNGRLRLHDARITAWKEAGRRGEEVEQQDTGVEAPAAEAERLFRTGYTHCRQRRLGECEETMRKVARRDSAFRRQAYRLQTWASMQQNPDVSHREMPEVDYGPGNSGGAGADRADTETGTGNFADDGDAATLSGDTRAGPDAGAVARSGAGRN